MVVFYPVKGNKKETMIIVQWLIEAFDTFILLKKLW